MKHDEVDQSDARTKPSETSPDQHEPRDPVSEREARNRPQNPSEESLTEGEREAVTEHGSLSALSVYAVILREGEGELKRPVTSLWWSGVAAGVGISTSVLTEGIIQAKLGADHPYLALIQSLGYSFGFVLVILCRLQLFTENTITVVLPMLAEPSRRRFYCTARLWGVVLAANLFGTFMTAAISLYGGVITADTLTAVLEISRHVAELTPAEAFLRAIPAGFLIAALVWMLPSAKGSEVLVIVMFTWLIAVAGFTHVIAGSNEIFFLVLSGDMNILTALTYHILPVLIGNVLGGTGLFAMLAHGQVHEEIR
ncbi:MAG: formate/nitrite transporter family protein [Halopseudomonas sabulinigri]